MGTISNKLVFTALITIVILISSCSQNNDKVTGTIGKEKLSSSEIVICVYGTKACLPVKIDQEQTIKFQGKETKLTDLPFGLYLEAEMTGDVKGGKKIKKISIDETKTVICFNGLNNNQEAKLTQLLKNINGVKTFKINSGSSQAYIEYEPKTVTYKDLENKIINEGFEIEQNKE